MKEGVVAQGPRAKPNSLFAYTVVLLRHGGRYLLLHRAAAKEFAPGRWTGIGGKVERDEFDDLAASALRELAEETGIVAADVECFTLRRVLLLARPRGPLILLLYFTGSLAAAVMPPCPEGTLAWVTAEALAALDVIQTTRPVLPLLIEDQERDPEGLGRVRLGLVDWAPDATVRRLVWM